MVDISALVVNETRIRDSDGFYGTVVYLGAVASAKNSEEVYAGVQWDDTSRGKHDGSVVCRRTNQLVRHFACGPTQGSFLRLNKIDLGVTLDAALMKSKYVEMDAPLVAPNNILPHAARTSSGKEKPVEFLGELKIRKQQQLNDIHKISLRCQGISRCYDRNELEEFQNINDIDLAGNLLSNWRTVMEIMHCFPDIQSFSIASNRVRDIHAGILPAIDLPPTLTQLRVLNLNRCGIETCRTMVWIGEAMPNLEELCIAYSDMSDLTSNEMDKGLFSNLRLLDCSSCNLTDWNTQVAKFGNFVKLAHLSLDDNPLAMIPSDANKMDETDIFSALSSLQIAGTLMSSWRHLSGLHTLAVQSLRLKMTPLTSSMGQGEARSTAIAHFPHLQYLNGSLVSSSERKEAERRYVSVITRLFQTANLDERDKDKNVRSLCDEHPQYETLKEKHKDVIVSESFEKSGGSTLSASVSNLTIRSMAASSCSMEPLIRRLPGSLTVGRLKALCARYFGLDVDLMSLHFRTASDAFPSELEDDENTLDYYGVSDGAEVLMNEVDAQDLANRSKGAAEDFARKVTKQENDLNALQELQRQMNSGVAR